MLLEIWMGGAPTEGGLEKPNESIIRDNYLSH